MCSSDLTWTTVPINTGLSQFWGIAAGAGRLVMVGDGGLIYSSADAGATWTAAASGVTSALRSVAFADDLFVAAGDSGRVLTSRDGSNWTNRSLPVTSSFTGVARHKGAWIVRSGTTIFSSPDGATWNRVTASGASGLATYRMLSVGGVLLSGHSDATLQISEVPGAWETHRTEVTTNSIRAFAVGTSALVAVGSNGLIYSTGIPSAGAALLPAPSLRLEADSIKVDVGRKNLLAVSGAGFTRLELYVNGSKVSEITGSAGALPWTPPTVGNYLLTVQIGRAHV